MRCPTCRAESASGKRFCADCGATLPVRCPKCRAESPPGKAFCADCGAPLDAPSLPRKERSLPRTEGLLRIAGESSEVLAGERKTVTALFADIKGSMELIEGLDPEEARAIVDPALKLMMDAVHPCPRCVHIILPQGDLPHDPGILRTVAQLNMREIGEFGTLPCAGVYADVVKPGTISRGDAVQWLD